MDNLGRIFTHIDPDINHFDYNSNFNSYTIDSFLNNSDIDNKSLKVIHHNARSLMTPGRLDQYDILLKEIKNPFDILIFTETWLTPEKSALCKFDGFQSSHLYRPVDNHIDFKDKGWWNINVPRIWTQI